MHRTALEEWSLDGWSKEGHFGLRKYVTTSDWQYFL